MIQMQFDAIYHVFDWMSSGEQQNRVSLPTIINVPVRPILGFPVF